MPRVGASIAAAAAAAAAADKTPGASVGRRRTRKQQQQQQQQELQVQQHQQDHQEAQNPQRHLQQHLRVLTPRLTPIEKRLTRLSISGGPSVTPTLSAVSRQGNCKKQGPPTKQTTPVSAQRPPISSCRQWISTPVKRSSSSSSCASVLAATPISRGVARQQLTGGQAEAVSVASPRSAVSALTRSRSASGIPSPKGGRPAGSPSMRPSVSRALGTTAFVDLRDLAGGRRGTRLSASPSSSRSSSQNKGAQKGASPSGASLWGPHDAEELYGLALQSLRPSTAGYCGGREEYEKEVSDFVHK